MRSVKGKRDKGLAGNDRKEAPVFMGFIEPTRTFTELTE